MIITYADCNYRWIYSESRDLSWEAFEKLGELKYYDRTPATEGGGGGREENFYHQQKNFK